MMESFIIWFVILAVSLAAASHLFMRNGRRRHGGGMKKELPPGPPALVFLAKFVALRRSIFHIGTLLRELHARHGPVICVRFFRRTLVFIADRDIAHRVLVQSGSTFAGRSALLVEPWRLFLSRVTITSTYGSYWRLVRRNLTTEVLHPARVELFQPGRRRALDALVSALQQGGAVVALRPFVRPALLEILLYMSLGACRLGPDILDEIQELNLRIMHGITRFPVFSVFPALTKRLLFRNKWAGYVAVWQRRREIFLPLIQARRVAVPGLGDPPYCYADSLLALRVAEEGGRPLTDDEVVNLCGEFLLGGTDTTLCLLEWIMAELVVHPEMQAKVYEEAVRASGDRQLSEADLRAMPYLKAVVLEGLRLHPPGQALAPHSVHHHAAEIDGYAVPKGAEVNFLVADFGLDEKVWTAPATEFRPERFLDGGEGCDMDITGTREIKMMPFGAGRRMCPGYALGMFHVEYFVGNLVKEFQWLPPAEGESVDMTEELDITTDMKHPLRARIIQRELPASN